MSEEEISVPSAYRAQYVSSPVLNPAISACHSQQQRKPIGTGARRVGVLQTHPRPHVPATFQLKIKIRFSPQHRPCYSQPDPHRMPSPRLQVSEQEHGLYWHNLRTWRSESTAHAGYSYIVYLNTLNKFQSARIQEATFPFQTLWRTL